MTPRVAMPEHMPMVVFTPNSPLHTLRHPGSVLKFLDRSVNALVNEYLKYVLLTLAMFFSYSFVNENITLHIVFTITMNMDTLWNRGEIGDYKL